jgi:bacterioferritin-associated ferredoxin
MDFDELYEAIRKAGWKTATEVGHATGCGAQCGLCKPYIARMLADGRVPLLSDLMSPAEVARWDID